MSLNIYGKLPSGLRQKRIQSSSNYRDGSFQNQSKTNAMAEDASILKTLKEYMNKPKNVIPSGVLPTIKSDLHQLDGEHPSLVWFGHSSYLLKLADKHILVDPVFSGNAAPLSFMIKAFKGADIYTLKDLPQIEILLITHDHYDHLDHRLMLQLKGKVKQIVCSLGVGSHLEHWGFNPKIIHELDWWEQIELENLSFTATPARHFSGRGIKRGQTLWSSFVVQSAEHKFYLGGDSGYDHHFKTIGQKFGGFDLAILESGQYNTSWPHIHMMPEETVLAGTELNAKMILPVHWGKFALGMHAWNEPPERVVAKAVELGIDVASPMIGEVYRIGSEHPNKRWWRI
ncbi:MAG: MBL fold metallo-hydrolase [bacterium]|nr:MBL fold metallo-hydrolase [bacterium]